jgi:hexokinase
LEYQTDKSKAYFEKVQNIPKWEGDAKSDEMAINMEWGAFDEERRVLPVTIYDNKLDRESINPRAHIYEKMISGMYLGEIVRNMALSLVDRNLLFNGHSSAELNKQWSFQTSHMSAIEVDKSLDLTDTQYVLETVLSISNTTLLDREIVKTLCRLVGIRAARLSSAGVGAVMSHCNFLPQNACTAAVDGTVFEYYPHFSHNMMKALKELFGDEVEKKIKFSQSHDGSGLGAAVIAMQVSK